MKVRELSAAVAELDQALAYYGRIETRLARALLEEVQAAKQSIMRFPLAWKPLPGDLRSFTLDRFPYALIYRPSPEEILIIAYAHLRRQPDYWRERWPSTH
jgi:toxin ParE2